METVTDISPKPSLQTMLMLLVFVVGLLGSAAWLARRTQGFGLRAENPLRKLSR